ncbi:MAG: hypothetical protein HQL30_10630 [Candidatus Omnitrophica bacterium]|nr:hypothetical protein [Candidatus Omnitrophota bacterium]
MTDGYVEMPSYFRSFLREKKEEKIASDPLAAVAELRDRVEKTRDKRTALTEELDLIEGSLDGFIGNMELINRRLKDMHGALAKVPQAPEAPVKPAATGGISMDEFKTYFESMLKGSLESVSDKISDKMAKMLGELRGLAGPAREAKIREIEEATGFANIDFSKLYQKSDVQSNIGDVGVEEKESKGIDSSLDKLRKMRGGKPKGDSSGDKKA